MTSDSHGHLMNAAESLISLILFLANVCLIPFSIGMYVCCHIWQKPVTKFSLFYVGCVQTYSKILLNIILILFILVMQGSLCLIFVCIDFGKKNQELQNQETGSKEVWFMMSPTNKKVSTVKDYVLKKKIVSSFLILFVIIVFQWLILLCFLYLLLAWQTKYHSFSLLCCVLMDLFI